jgi:NAD(P)-dependent dehydrogenase (short-subunit alcohol dehydrogenase family)
MAETSRVAIVTGAAGGIGRAFVKGLLGAGYRVAAADRTAEGLAALMAENGRQRGGPDLLTIEADLAADGIAKKIVAEAKAKFGRVDILVNNAGVGQATIRVVPDMVAAKWGRIVNVTTSLGTMIRAGSPSYGPSKAALEAMSAVMAKDLTGTGVTVNVLVPGGVTNTGMVPHESGFDRDRMIQPQVMAPPLAWLVSDEAADTTGRRFLAVHWDSALPPREAAEKSGAPVAWTEIATLPIEPGR